MKKLLVVLLVLLVVEVSAEIDGGVGERGFLDYVKEGVLIDFNSWMVEEKNEEKIIKETKKNSK